MKMDGQQEQETFNVDEMEFNTFEMPPPGEFKAIFKEAKGVMIDYGKGEGPQKAVELHFILDAMKENGEPHTIRVSTAPSFSSKGRIRPLITAFGDDVDKINPRQFKLSSYFGKKLRLYLVEEPKKDGTGKRTVIQAFLPLKAAAKASNGNTPATPSPFDDPDE